MKRRLLGLLLLSSSLLWAQAPQVSTANTIRFEDATAKSGIQFTHSFGAERLGSLLESTGSGCVWFDYNNDGLLDLYVVSGKPLEEGMHPYPLKQPPAVPPHNHLYKNNGDGTFTDVTDQAGVAANIFGTAAIAADFDNDGFVDLFVTGYGKAILYHNNGDGTFSDVTAKAGIKVDGWSISSAWLDYDRDGCVDLFVGRYVKFDPNSKNIAPLFLAQVHNGAISYRRITMEKPYARVGENGVGYSGPALPDEKVPQREIGVFGPHADEIVSSPETARWLRTLNAHGQNLSLIPISSDASWGKASDDLVKAVYQEHVLAVLALDRPSSHLAEQIAVKAFVPVVAISSDRALTSTNIPWIFRLPDRTSLEQALECLSAAITQAGPNRGKIRELLSSGASFAGISFESTGELRKPTMASSHD